MDWTIIKLSLGKLHEIPTDTLREWLSCPQPNTVLASVEEFKKAMILIRKELERRDRNDTAEKERIIQGGRHADLHGTAKSGNLATWVTGVVALLAFGLSLFQVFGCGSKRAQAELESRLSSVEDRLSNAEHRIESLERANKGAMLLPASHNSPSSARALGVPTPSAATAKEPPLPAATGETTPPPAKE
jgi:hypothetical protein